MNEAVLETLSAIHPAILHPKHKYLKTVLESPNGGISSAFDRPRQLSFLQFAKTTTDRFQCLIAQNLYCLHLDELNDILEYAGFEQVNSTQEFDTDTSTSNALALSNEQSGHTMKQQLFISYINNCKRRVTSNTTLFDWKPKLQSSYKCEFCGNTHGCKGHLKRHQEHVHENKPKKKYRCDNCGETFSDSRILKTNNQVKHLQLLKQWPCRHIEYDKKRNDRRDIEKHYKLAHIYKEQNTGN